jgi:hypothetical protein
MDCATAFRSAGAMVQRGIDARNPSASGCGQATTRASPYAGKNFVTGESTPP